MKRSITIIGVLLLLLVVLFQIGSCEDQASLYVVRPAVRAKTYSQTEEIVFSFGTRLNFVEDYDEKYIVVERFGSKYLIQRGYVDFGYHKMLQIDDIGVALSPRPYMKENDYGYCAGGFRYDEKAIILFIDGDCYFIVTDEGFSGFVKTDSEHISFLDY